MRKSSRCVWRSRSRGIPSDRRFLRVAAKQLGHLFPELPSAFTAGVCGATRH